MNVAEKTSRVLQVQRGVVVPPAVLQTMLPDVASIVTGAITADSRCKKQNQKTILNLFSCHICKLAFPTRHTLNVHLLSHEFECYACKIIFKSRKLMLKHKCCICKICNKPRARTNHKKCPKVITCKCGEKFTRKKEFTRHQKTHVDIYGNCPTCTSQFISQTDLIDHVNKMKFPCIYCGSCFSNLDELSEHTVLPEPPKYSCHICKETFEDSFAVTSHSRTHAAPIRMYSKKPKAAIEKKLEANAKEPLSNVKEENPEEKPSESEGVNGKLDVCDDEGALLTKVKREPCERLDENVEIEGTEPELQCTKMEFDFDEEGLAVGPPEDFEVVNVKPEFIEDIEIEYNKQELDSIESDDLKLSPEQTVLQLEHLVKDELELGPVLVQAPISAGQNDSQNTTWNQEATKNLPCTGQVQGPSLVKPEPVDSDECGALDTKTCLASLKQECI